MQIFMGEWDKEYLLFFTDNLIGLMVVCSPWFRELLGSIPGKVTSQTLKLELAAFLLLPWLNDLGDTAKTGDQNQNNVCEWVSMPTCRLLFLSVSVLLVNHSSKLHQISAIGHLILINLFTDKLYHQGVFSWCRWINWTFGVWF